MKARNRKISFLFAFAVAALAAREPRSTLADDPHPIVGSPTNLPNQVRLNFRGAPLDSVLRYLSEAAGWIVDVKTDVRGKFDVWSAQPISRDEAFALLESALETNGYTALRNGRTLTIVTQDDARKRDLPVKVGNTPEAIPRDQQIVTQIIPVHYVSAVQISRDLQPLLPEHAKLVANEGGNAIIITDAQASIHRLVEIVHALDTALATTSSIRVFPLRFADAKGLAGVFKDLYQPQESSRSNAQDQGRVVNALQSDDAGQPAPASGSAQPTDRSRGAAGGRAPTPRLVAVAEERSNSVVVSAPEEQMETVASLVRKLDVNVQDVTEVRVFHLKNADAQETADLLASLFGGSSSRTGQNGQASPVSEAQFVGGGPVGNGPGVGRGFGSGASPGANGFPGARSIGSEGSAGAGPQGPNFSGGGPGFGGGGPGENRFGGGGAFPGFLEIGGGPASVDGASSDQSASQQKQSTVVAVADLRTGSVVVTAGRRVMVQIGKMIEELDADASKKQQVFVYSLQNTDGQVAQSILESLFSSSTSSVNSQSNSRQNGVGNQLSNRANQNQSQRSGTSGNSSFGGMGSGLGGSGGLGR